MIRHVFPFVLGLLLVAGPACAAEPRAPAEHDRCPVCGMFVAPYPDWTATILFKDGSQLFFDGPKDLYRYYSGMPQPQDSLGPKDIAGIYLTEYYSTRLMPVEQLLLVLGSDVYGPMGHEFVPVAGEETAATFARDHGGRKILHFNELTPELIPAN